MTKRIIPDLEYLGPKYVLVPKMPRKINRAVLFTNLDFEGK